MYKFTDIIKNRFLEEFSEITIGSLLTALLLSCVLSLFVVFIYRVTYSGSLWNGSFAVSLILLAMVTSLVIITVSSNVVLSLGMVGALSIVRFRTAVKEPMDTIYMFWAIVVGITTGAGLVPTAIIATLLIGLVMLVIHLATGKRMSGLYMVVVRFESAASEGVEEEVKKIKTAKIKSRGATPAGEELILEVRLSDTVRETFDQLKKMEGVSEVNLLSYSGSTLL